MRVFFFKLMNFLCLRLINPYIFMTNLYRLLLLALIIVPLNLYSQNNSDAKLKIKEGDKFFEKGVSEFENALVNYLDAYQITPKNAILCYKIGHIYFTTNRLEQAVPFFEKSVTISGDKSSESQYYLSRSYQLLGANDKAIEEFNAYKSALNNNSKISAEIKHLQIDRTETHIRHAQNAKEITKQEVPILIRNMGSKVNSAYPDYAPIITDDMKTIYFTSRRKGSTGGKIDKEDKFEFEDIYTSTLDNNEQWSEPVKIKGAVNTKTHEATVTLSSDGKRMIIYRPDANGDLFESIQTNGEWSKPLPLKGINSKYREVHATFSPDGNTIYFTSNNPLYAMNGSMDILVSTRQTNGIWSKPVNIGSDINTNNDELYVHMSSDGKTLYFSSEGHNSIGGFDIFKCNLQEDGKWSVPINVGYPINSIGDDISMYFSKNGDIGWFDSDRKGGFGYKDIYQMINLSGRKKPVIIEVREKGSEKLLTADVTLTPTKSKETEIIKLESDQNLIYQKEVNVFEKFQLNVSKKFYTSHSSEISTYFSSFDSIETPVKKVVYLELPNNLLFKGATFDKETLKPVHPVIEVFANNKRIMRADSSKGGEFSLTLNRGKSYHLIARADGYLPLRDTFIVDTNNLEKKFYLNKIKLNQKFELKNIYFETAKADLRPESEAELSSLKNFLEENPSVVVEISAHTDNVGNKAYNQKLSESRAKSVVKWLSENGIPAAQMTSKGYGMSQPIVANDSDENRQKNRRVEFKILRIMNTSSK